MITVRPRVLIDCSGDLDALRQAGARFLELADGEALQPATMMFRFGPVYFARFDALPREEIAALARRGFEQGQLARAALHASRDPFSNDAWFNISRLALDATDALALGRAEIEGGRQAWRAGPTCASRCPAASTAACWPSARRWACARRAVSRAITC